MPSPQAWSSAISECYETHICTFIMYILAHVCIHPLDKRLCLSLSLSVLFPTLPVSLFLVVSLFFFFFCRFFAFSQSNGQQVPRLSFLGRFVLGCGFFLYFFCFWYFFVFVVFSPLPRWFFSFRQKVFHKRFFPRRRVCTFQKIFLLLLESLFSASALWQRSCQQEFSRYQKIS